MIKEKVKHTKLQVNGKFQIVPFMLTGEDYPLFRIKTGKSLFKM